MEAGGGLPEQICSQCVKRLREAFQFRHQCHESNANLRVQYPLNTSEIKPEIVFDAVDLPSCNWDVFDDNYADSDVPLNDLKKCKINLNASDREKGKKVGRLKKKKTKTDEEKMTRKIKRLEKLAKLQHKQDAIKLSNSADNPTQLNSLSTSNNDLINDIDSFDLLSSTQDKILVKNEPEFYDNNINPKLSENVQVQNGQQIKDDIKPQGKKKKSKQDSKKLYYCDICGHSVKVKFDLITHFRRHTGEKPYKCETCGKQFAHDAGLRTHQRQHSGLKSFVCDVCGKVLSTKDTLLAHRRLHTGELPFTCPTCGRAFRALTNLRSHRKIHTGDKRHPCPVCNKLFYTKSDMRNHARRHTGERPYSCPLCPQRFTGKSNHRLHMKIHAGQKDFQCPLCPKTFVSRDSMRRHGKIHTGERSFECQECNRRFAHRSTLMSHQAIHSKTKDYICDICCQRFGYPSGLYVHRKKKHNIQSSRLVTTVT